MSKYWDRLYKDLQGKTKYNGQQAHKALAHSVCSNFMESQHTDYKLKPGILAGYLEDCMTKGEKWALEMCYYKGYDKDLVQVLIRLQVLKEYASNKGKVKRVTEMKFQDLALTIVHLLADMTLNYGYDDYTDTQKDAAWSLVGRSLSDYKWQHRKKC